MQAEMHKNNADLIKWGAGVGLTLVAVTISVLTFVVKTSVDKPPPQPVLQMQAPPAGPVSAPK